MSRSGSKTYAVEEWDFVALFTKGKKVVYECSVGARNRSSWDGKMGDGQAG